VLLAPFCRFFVNLIKKSLTICLWVNEEGTYVTNEFISYVRPLIQGDVSPVMVDGIPRHLYTPKELSHR